MHLLTSLELPATAGSTGSPILVIPERDRDRELGTLPLFDPHPSNAGDAEYGGLHRSWTTASHIRPTKMSTRYIFLFSYQTLIVIPHDIVRAFKCLAWTTDFRFSTLFRIMAFGLGMVLHGANGDDFDFF